MADKGLFYERVKLENIYPKWFPLEAQLDEFAFRKAVHNAYDEILILISELNGNGSSDEDYYMAEWLYENRRQYSVVASKTQLELANFIYQIRK